MITVLFFLLETHVYSNREMHAICIKSVERKYQLISVLFFWHADSFFMGAASQIIYIYIYKYDLYVCVSMHLCIYCIFCN